MFISSKIVSILVLFLVMVFQSNILPYILAETSKTTHLISVYLQVITAQYFVWFFCLWPLILPWSKMNLKWDGLSCILLWIGAQTHWLMWGYLLEFKGKNVFLQLWVASLVFLAANIFILVMMIRHHRCASVFKGLEHANSKNVAKLEWVTLIHHEWFSSLLLLSVTVAFLQVW